MTNDEPDQNDLYQAAIDAVIRLHAGVSSSVSNSEIIEQLRRLRSEIDILIEATENEIVAETLTKEEEDLFKGGGGGQPEGRDL